MAKTIYTVSVWKTKCVEHTNAYGEPAYGWSEEELLFRCYRLTKPAAVKLLEAIDLEAVYTHNACMKRDGLAPDFNERIGYVAYVCRERDGEAGECIDFRKFKPEL